MSNRKQISEHTLLYVGGTADVWTLIAGVVNLTLNTGNGDEPAEAIIDKVAMTIRLDAKATTDALGVAINTAIRISLERTA